MLAGIDTHKDTLAVAVIDDAGRPVVVTEAANTEAGFDSLERLLTAHSVTRVGIEGSGNYGRGAAVHLVLTGSFEVVEVPPSLTSRERSGRPGAGKTDPVDAVAIARITAREPALPQVRLAVGQAADLRALADYRAQLVAERTALANRTHSELHGLLPGYQADIPRLTAPTFITKAQDLLAGQTSVRALLTRRRLARLAELTAEIREVADLITAAVAEVDTGLTELYGLGPIGAATILGEVADVRRYRSRHAFAAANGTAPIPASSGRTSRHRLNRSGNRTLNRVLYTMAITQIRADTEGRAYYLRKRAEGKTGREALRCLKRRLSDVVFKTLHEDLAAGRAPTAIGR
ncbi:IS110 family transposase [Modestobacter sp. VKM Ac-2984]|uniref:IS110 family transposase n=1 Tax=Modestobacter sp. VKM Ac-2984 TaxID=3004138 RepID=UPI0022AABB35|nr:IS110 family transposase [Modestobacter sp. VKM Ac-2984]MCZ2818711.1 IS110 family transposase [Modestobacter sp. VKM Ac-2984]